MKKFFLGILTVVATTLPAQQFISSRDIFETINSQLNHSQFQAAEVNDTSYAVLLPNLELNYDDSRVISFGVTYPVKGRMLLLSGRRISDLNSEIAAVEEMIDRKHIVFRLMDKFYNLSALKTIHYRTEQLIDIVGEDGISSDENRIHDYLLRYSLILENHVDRELAALHAYGISVSIDDIPWIGAHPVNLLPFLQETWSEDLQLSDFSNSSFSTLSMLYERQNSLWEAYNNVEILPDLDLSFRNSDVSNLSNSEIGMRLNWRYGPLSAGANMSYDLSETAEPLAYSLSLNINPQNPFIPRSNTVKFNYDQMANISSLIANLDSMLLNFQLGLQKGFYYADLLFNIDNSINNNLDLLIQYLEDYADDTWSIAEFYKLSIKLIDETGNIDL